VKENNRMSTGTCNRREFIAKAAAMAAGLGSYQLWAAAEKQDEAIPTLRHVSSKVAMPMAGA
jgi:hypothetical protein